MTARLERGVRVGGYEILGFIAEGGMGAVYRARDLSLDREVALKVLSEGLTTDRERLERFEREAKVLATLNDAHIGAIYGLAESEGVRALVLELVEGPTLADLVARGPLGVEEALRISEQVARALQAAHQRGVVHRDLKPSNVKLGAEGGVKVLDFGLARLAEPAKGAGERDDAPATSLVTRASGVTGTPPYMSPEQLAGHPADTRTDIWGLGCLVYELLTGSRAFGGRTVWQAVAAVLEQQPDWDRLPRATPERIRLLVERCLRKDPAERLHHVGDARIEISEALDGLRAARGRRDGTAAERSRVATAPSRVGERRTRALVTLIGLSAVAAAGTLGYLVAHGSGSAGGGAVGAPVSFSVPLPAGMTIGPGEVETYLAVSPDGEYLVYRGGGTNSPLHLHSFRDGATRTLAQTGGASSPFWSPDSRAIGYFQAGQLRTIDRTGGPPRVVTDANWEAGNSWSRDDVILFAQPARGGIAIHAVPATGGDATSVTEVDPEQEIGHMWPHFLPDGRRFLYVALERSADPVPPRHLYVGSLDGDPRRLLSSAASRAEHADPTTLVYATEGVLVAHDFDPQRLELVGDARPITDELRYFHMTGQAEFSVARNEARPVVAFHGGAWTSRIVVYDRAGTRLGTLGPEAAFDQLRVSPDGTRLAVDVLDPTNGGRDLWIYDIESGRSRRLTINRADEHDPVWSPDGTRIAYRSDVNGPPDLHVRSADGSGEARVVLSGPQVFTPEDWSPDGSTVLYQLASRSTGADLWVTPIDGGGEPRPLVRTRYAEVDGRFSPDGRWIAFVSDESGRPEVYVAPVEEPGARLAVSGSGGLSPRWRGDGGELYYLGPSSTVMAVSIGGGPTLDPAEPRTLFELDGATFSSSHDVTPDGERFLVNEVVEDVTVAPIRVVFNWKAGS